MPWGIGMADEIHDDGSGMTWRAPADGPAGRPRIEINEEALRRLCQLHATLVECAAFFRVSEDTIERRCKELGYAHFAEFQAENRAVGNVSIRRKQYQLAMEGDKTMLIWLGKQMLGQTDRADQTLQHKGSGVVVYIPDNGRDGYVEGSNTNEGDDGGSG